MVAVAGAALAVLHDQNPWRLAPRDRRKDEASLRNVAQVIRYLCPDRGEFAAGLAHHLADRLHDTAPVPRALHGNFQARHVLLAGAGVAFLDFDRAARGNPASDIGNFLANLELMVLARQMSEATAAGLRTSLLDGYQAKLRRVAPAWIEVYTSLSLFQQALTPFRLRAPDWPAQAGNAARPLRQPGGLAHPCHADQGRTQRQRHGVRHADTGRVVNKVGGAILHVS